MMSLSKSFVLSLAFIITIGSGSCPINASEETRPHSHQHEEEDRHDDHEDNSSSDAERITLDNETRRMIGMQTDRVRSMNLKEKIRVYGRIAKDAQNYSYVTSPTVGIIEKIHVQTGHVVDEGDLLITIRRDDGGVEPVSSPKHGVVLSIFVQPGERINPWAAPLLSLADMDKMRTVVHVYEKDLQYVHLGQNVIITTPAFPDREFKGSVAYISPQIDDHTQTIQVRVDVDNPDHLLRMGMFVTGELIYDSGRPALTVPEEAVQKLNGKDVVFLLADETGNNIRMQEVVLGRWIGSQVEILDGLNEGDVVVTKGSFYLKSELDKESFGHGHAH